MKTIKLIVTELFTPSDFNRGKLAKAVKEQVSAAGVAITREVSTEIFTEIDTLSKGISLKDTYLSKVKSSQRINSNLEIENGYSCQYVSTVKLTETESLRQAYSILEKQTAEFILKPSEMKLKRMYKTRTVCNAWVHKLLKSKNPEDITIATNFDKALLKLEEQVKIKVA